MRLKIISIFFFAFLLYYKVSGQEPITYSGGKSILLQKKQIEFYIDKTGKLPFSEIKSSAVFSNPEKSVSNLGWESGNIWLRLKIDNQSGKDALMLSIDYPLLDLFELYDADKEKPIQSVGLEMDQKKGFKNRQNQHQNPALYFEVPVNTSRELYFCIKNKGQTTLPLYLGSVEKIYETNTQGDIIFGIYLGIFLIMFLYNLFIFFSVREKSYLWYVFYILTVLFVQVSLLGYGYRFIWHGWQTFSDRSLYMAGALSGIASGLFLRSFLNTKINAPTLDRYIIGFIALYFVSLILSIIGLYQLSYNLTSLAGFLGGLFILYTGIYLRRRGKKEARFFLIAWTAFLLSVFVFVLKDFGLFPYTFFTKYVLLIGSSIEVLFLSFALGDAINTLKKAKEEAQVATLNALRENERIIKDQNIILEKKVTERTQELRTALENLKKTQTQLVNAEKMSSLGQLTAGIAHEINNPINFVTSSILPLRRDVEDIITILNEYEKLETIETMNDGLGRISKLKKDLDLDYLIDEINQLLKGIDEGANRTSQIVKGLQKFSRLDEDTIKKTNVVDGIEATLTLLNNQIKGIISLEKEYNDIPEIECYPGKLNQVFMNILSNAIQAIHDNKKDEKRIRIVTQNQKDTVSISFSDNGYGMSEKTKNKIFEPFFTTKDVGVGTGLGLSIAYGIIQDHNGEILVESKEGEGTTFTLILPKFQVREPIRIIDEQ